MTHMGLGELRTTGMVVPSRQVESEEALRARLKETASHPGPVLIAARIAARVCPEMMRALRGDS